MKQLLFTLFITLSLTTFAQEGKDPSIPKAGEQPLDKPIQEDQSKRPKEPTTNKTAIVNANAVATGNPVGQSPAASPEVAFNNRIKDIPVNLFTATPILNFPIYTLSEPGGTSTSMFFNYNASGMRGGEVASSTGLNMTLNAGAMITRVTRGIPDEGKFEIENINSRSFKGRKGFYNFGVANDNNDENKQNDTQPDLFYLNDDGANYKFSFDASHKAHFYPDADIKVSVVWSPLGQGVGEFSSWEITMPNGTKYFFSKEYSEATFELEAIEAKNTYTVDSDEFIDYQKAEKITSAWYLVKKVTAFGHETNFEYTKNQYSFFKLAEQEIQTNDCSFGAVSKKINKVYVSSSTIKRISNINIEVEFNKDEILCVGDICGTTSSYPNRIDIDAWATNPANGSNAKILKKITVHDKNSPSTAPKMEWTMDYEYIDDNGTETSPPFGYTYLQVGYTHQRRLILRKLNLPDGTNYLFKYYEDNANGVPNRFALTDHWGFLNGFYGVGLLIGKDSYRNCANNSLAIREASVGWSQYGTMSSFHHSLGSNTYLEYENHKAENYKDGSDYILIGGNRLTKITQTDSVSNINTVKTYSYEDGLGASSGLLCLKPVYRFDSESGEQQEEYWNSALYSMLLSESGKPAVSYSRVKETIASGAVNASANDHIGSTVSFFDREQQEINVVQTTYSNCTPYPNIVCDTTRFTRPWLWNPYHSYKDGTPTQVLIYNKGGSLISSKSMEYDESYYSENLNDNYYPYQASKRPFRMNGKNYSFENNYYEFYYKHRLKKEINSTYNLDGTGEVKTETTHFYKDEMPSAYRTAYPGKHNQLVKSVTTNSNGHLLESFTKYAADFDFGRDSLLVCYQYDPETNDCTAEAYQYSNHEPTNQEAKGIYQLKEKHIINGFVESISKQNDNITSASYQTYYPETTTDAKAGLPKSNYVIENIPRSSMIEANFTNGNWSKDADYDQKSTVEKYNLWGLPIQMVDKYGATSKIDYDFTNTLPIKTYKNFGKPDQQTTQTEYDTKIFGISKEIGTNALEVRKEFYPDGKLKQILDKDNNVLKHITYLYRSTEDAIFGTDQNKNRVITRVPRILAGDATSLTHLNCNISIQYADGAGRGMQTIEYRASPASKDIISGTVEYDVFGRPFKTFLPVESEFDDGRFVDTTTVQTRAKAFYGANEVVFSEMIYENSPLSRTLKSFGPGKAWRDLGIGSEMDYQTVYVATDIKKIDALVNENKGFIGAYTNDGQLLKKVSLDERESFVREYSDKMGNVIRRVVQSSDTDSLITAYVYDDANRLRYVLPPNAYNAVINQTEFDENDPAFNEMIYAYHYDGRGRVYETHTPGTGWSRVVYNRLNQPVLTQDDDEASTNTWNYAQTDGQGRTVRAGQIQPPYDRAGLQALFDNYTTVNSVDALLFEERSTDAGHVAQYTNRSFPNQLQSLITAQSLKTVAYYDNYNWRNGIDAITGTAGNYDFQANTLNTSVYSRDNSAIGLNTGGLIKDDLNGDLLMPAVSYYDDKNRSIQSIAYNHLQARDQTDTKYNFNGEVANSKAVYRQAGNVDITRTTTHTYDHIGRPKSLFYGLSLYNGGAEFPMNFFSYDALGRLKTKYIKPSTPEIASSSHTGLWGLGATWQSGVIPDLQTLAIINTGHTVNIPNNASYQASSLLNNGTLNMGTGSLLTLGSMQNPGRVALQTIDYSYNIRSQLRGINLDASGNMQTGPEKLFSYKLDYHEDGRYYDGNISRQSWKSHSTIGGMGADARSYTYTYDRSNRIKNASFSGKENEAYGVSNISYDIMGNLQTMERFGKTGANSWGEIDKLAYSYINSGNRLQQIDDTGQNASTGGFINGNSGTDYSYTNAGKITSDLNKGISLIEYNSLDLVSKITKTNDDYIEYKYNSIGDKIATKRSIGGQISYTRYNGEIVYSSDSNLPENQNISEIQYAEGRFINNKFEYSYLDHLGNLRLSYRDSVMTTGGLMSLVTQESSYDPWGLEINGLNYNLANNPSDKFSWQRKENLEGDGLNNWTDFGWRIQDKTIGRWLTPDPEDQFEDASSFAYAVNNPISQVDPDGRALPIILAAAILGGGSNLWSNWSKVKGWKQGFAYFTSGAIGGIVSTIPGGAAIGGSITAGGNVAIDITTGNIPKFNNGWDVAKYAGGVALDGVGAAGMGKLAKTAAPKLAAYFGGEALVAGANAVNYSAQVGQLVKAGTEVIGDIAEATVRPAIRGLGQGATSSLIKQGLQKAANLNSNVAKSNFGIYEIIKDGQVFKYGKADLSRITQLSGKPTRLHQQLRKLQDLNPNSIITGNVIEDLGVMTTKNAKLIEKSYLDFFYKTNNKSIPFGNIKSYFGR